MIKSTNQMAAPPGSQNNSPGFLLNLKMGFQLLWLLLCTWFYALHFLYTSFFPPEGKKLSKDEIILVTGGANGIGREICLQLGKMENSVTIISWDVDETANDLIIQELKDLGIKKAYGFKVDVSNREEVEGTAEKIRQEIGHVSILFNNAGIIGEIGTGWKLSPASVQKVFDINLVSHCWTLREFLPSMIEKGRGHVIETCSVAGFLYGGFISPYIGSKQGLKGYVECLKEDLRNLPGTKDVHFSLVYPHVTQTNMVASVDYKVSNQSVVPHMTPRFVARQIIKGMLRNDEHIYVPANMRYMAMILPLLPPPIVRKIIDLLEIDMTKRK